MIAFEHAVFYAALNLVLYLAGYTALIWLLATACILVYGVSMYVHTVPLNHVAIRIDAFGRCDTIKPGMYISVPGFHQVLSYHVGNEIADNSAPTRTTLPTNSEFDVIEKMEGMPIEDMETRTSALLSAMIYYRCQLASIEDLVQKYGDGDLVRVCSQKFRECVPLSQHIVEMVRHTRQSKGLLTLTTQKNAAMQLAPDTRKQISEFQKSVNETHGLRVKSVTVSYAIDAIQQAAAQQQQQHQKTNGSSEDDMEHERGRRRRRRSTSASRSRRPRRLSSSRVRKQLTQ